MGNQHSQDHAVPVKQQSNLGASKMSNTHCNLCENPYPYMCSECMTSLYLDEEDVAEDQRLFEGRKNISSGEDVILEGIIL